MNFPKNKEIRLFIRMKMVFRRHSPSAHVLTLGCTFRSEKEGLICTFVLYKQHSFKAIGSELSIYCLQPGELFYEDLD